MIQARKTRRKPVTVDAEVRNARDLAWQVELADLSEGGCRFTLSAAPLSKGEGVKLLVAGAGSIRAKVSWRRGDEVGVAFETPLSGEFLAQLISGEGSASKTRLNSIRANSIRPC